MDEQLRTIVAHANAADGQAPFSDQSLVEQADGRRELLIGDDAAYAILLRGEPGEAELVVEPARRREGHGGRMLALLLQENPRLLLWAHGDHPAARRLAERHGLTATRTLLQMRAAVPTVPELVEGRPSTSSGNATSSVNITAFRPGVDDADWLRLNAAAFASHPEQGSLVQADLDARMAESWFDAQDFLLLRDDDGALIGFSWMKVDGDLGEFYAVGVDPARQGLRLGRTLVAAGLDRLAARGIRTSNLYVEADNEPAVRLYRSFGFSEHTIDVQYSTEG